MGSNTVRTGSNTVRTGSNTVRMGSNTVRTGSNTVRTGLNSKNGIKYSKNWHKMQQERIKNAVTIKKQETCQEPRNYGFKYSKYEIKTESERI